MSAATIARWRLRSNELTKAVRLLRAARSSLVTELSAIGPEEIKENPILRANESLVGRIDKFLEGKGCK